MSWYNDLRQESGVNVVVGGNGNGNAEGGGSVPSVWKAGDRFASVITDGTMSTWIENDGRWRLLKVAPVSQGVPTATLADWFAAFQVRLDAGTVAIDRITVRRGGLTEVTPAPVTFQDVSGTDHDTYTVPDVTGVVYRRGGVALAAGTYPGSGTVTVTAEAATGYGLALDATTTWTTTFATTVDPPSGPSAPVPPRATRAPEVTGAARVGKVLAATPGTWSAGGLTFDYRWLRDGRPVAGATGRTYRVVPADAGHRVAVEVTASTSPAAGQGPVQGTAISALTAPVRDARSTLTVKVPKKRVRAGKKATVKVKVKAPGVSRSSLSGRVRLVLVVRSATHGGKRHKVKKVKTAKAVSGARKLALRVPKKALRGTKATVKVVYQGAPGEARAHQKVRVRVVR
jgi:hypothetical protein